MEAKFAGPIIGVAGYSPFDDLAIERIVTLEGAALGGTVGQDATWQVGQLIVIGREDFDEDFLKESINIGFRHGFVCRYLSQEAFWEFWLYDEYEPYVEGDSRIEEHEGLSFLASIGFEFPSTDVTAGGGNLRGANTWNIEHDLRAKFGYSVRKGVPERKRRAALKEAVTSLDSLGLQVVAYHIAFNIKMRKRRNDDKMSSAVDRWESDLEWLRKTYYDKTIHSFKFPTY